MEMMLENRVDERHDGQPAWNRTRTTDSRQRLLHGYLHKTSNCLCGIKGYASLIASGQTAKPQIGTWAQKILAEVERMEHIYRSVQDVAFPEQREFVGSDLHATVEVAIAASCEQHDNLRVNCRPLPAGELLLPARDLELAIRELLSNSAESRSCSSGPEVVSVFLDAGITDPGLVELAICDDGQGIEPALLADIRDPFVTTRPGHLGIGLTRVETIMDMYGLAWSLDSRPDLGTNAVLEVAQSTEADHETPASRREG